MKKAVFIFMLLLCVSLAHANEMVDVSRLHEDEIKYESLMHPAGTGIELLKDESVLQNSEAQDYYKIIRQKIFNKAYQLYDRPDEGAVAIFFNLNAKGLIINLRVAEEKTTATPYLRNTALQAVRSIRRFPSFPKILREYKTLDFNIVVDFKVKK